MGRETGIADRLAASPVDDPVSDEAHDYALDLDLYPTDEAAAMRAYFDADKTERDAFRRWVAQKQYEWLAYGAPRGW